MPDNERCQRHSWSDISKPVVMDLQPHSLTLKDRISTWGFFSSNVFSKLTVLLAVFFDCLRFFVVGSDAAVSDDFTPGS